MSALENGYGWHFLRTPYSCTSRRLPYVSTMDTEPHCQATRRKAGSAGHQILCTDLAASSSTVPIRELRSSSYTRSSPAMSIVTSVPPVAR